jgi:hypothetical protein
MAIRSARIGVHIGGRVGILNPIELSLRDNQVGIGVIIQKWGNGAYSPINPAIIHYSTLWD